MGITEQTISSSVKNSFDLLPMIEAAEEISSGLQKQKKLKLDLSSDEMESIGTKEPKVHTSAICWGHHKRGHCLAWATQFC